MSDSSIYCAREQGRRAALSGREVWCNPHIGGDAADWFTGYREVPEAERGSQPDLKGRGKTFRKPKRVPMSQLQVRALGDRTLPGSTPRPQSMLTAEQIATRIAYHERVLTESVCVHQRARATRALSNLRAAVPCDAHSATPRPWAQAVTL